MRSTVTRTLRGSLDRYRWIVAIAACSLQACGAGDKVLTPDLPTDAGQANDAGGSSAEGPDANSGSAGEDAGTGSLIDAGNAQDDAGQIGDGVPHVAKDADCDLNGIWIGRQNTQSLALGILPQYANNWYYLELQQDGENVVVKDHFDCGIEVRGTVLVQLTPATTKALMQHNLQKGRKGTLKKQSDGTCAFEMERFWSVRGVSETKYVPKPRNSPQSIAQAQASNPLPPTAKPELTEDWDGDGKPGVRWDVSGNVPAGARHSAQRDWTHWFTAPGYTMSAKTNWDHDLVVRSEFGNEEVVYEASNDTLKQLSTPDATAEHTLTLRFLGRTRSDKRAKDVLKSAPFDSCLAIQGALTAIEGLK